MRSYELSPLVPKYICVVFWFFVSLASSYIGFILLSLHITSPPIFGILLTSINKGDLGYDSDDANTGAHHVPSASEPEHEDHDGYFENQQNEEPHSPDGASTTSRIGRRKSAFYDYKQEKALKDMDAKLFYHQQQYNQVPTPLYTQSGAGGSYSSPLIRAQTFSPNAGNPLSRTASMKSFGSHHYTQQPTHQSLALGRSAIPVASLEKPAGSDEVQSPSWMEKFDPSPATGSLLASSSSHGVGHAHEQGFASSRSPGTVFTVVHKIKFLSCKEGSSFRVAFSSPKHVSQVVLLLLLPGPARSTSRWHCLQI